MAWIQITYDNASNIIGHIDHSEKTTVSWTKWGLMLTDSQKEINKSSNQLNNFLKSFKFMLQNVMKFM
jgi:hypothetical protein